jgi:Amt family ammonium transporter
MRGKKLIVGAAAAIGATALGLMASGVAGAESLTETQVLGQQVNLLWVVIGAVLVIFMQAGFALVETGFCRAKHATHVVSTNFAIFGLGFVGFFLVGYAFMFGGFSYSAFGYNAAIGKPLIGSGHWVFLWKGGFALGDIGKAGGAAVAGFFLYMVAFMDTTATIPTGSMAERWKWKSFVIWGFFCGAIYYPLFGAWTWGGGWLSQLGNSMKWGLGYVDFAGSGVVHAVGGVAALAGSLVLGARIGKFNADGSPNTIPGHHVPMAMLGTFILLFGWFGFNAASTFAATDTTFALVAANTGIAAAFGAVTAMFFMTWTTGKPDPGMMVNGMLGGLVAITAPCAFVDPWAAAAIGIIAGVLIPVAANFIEKRGVDDPVGAIAVHGVGGIFGVLAVGLFANGKYGAGWNLTTEGDAAGKGVTGIFYGSDGVGQLISQAVGVVVLCTVIFGVAFAFFKIQNSLTKGGIRSEEADEIAGLDMPEMGAVAYPEFHLHEEDYSGHGGGSPTLEEKVEVPTP